MLLGLAFSSLRVLQITGRKLSTRYCCVFCTNCDNFLVTLEASPDGSLADFVEFLNFENFSTILKQLFESELNLF